MSVTQHNGNGLGASPEDLADAPDFGRARRRNLFKVDSEVFEAAPALPVDQALEFINLAERWSGEDVTGSQELIRELFSKVLLPESAERFASRLSDTSRPIEITQLQPIIEWLLERLGFRPTEPSPASSTGSGSPADGTNSAGASPSQASISTASPSTAP